MIDAMHVFAALSITVVLGGDVKAEIAEPDVAGTIDQPAQVLASKPLATGDEPRVDNPVDA